MRNTFTIARSEAFSIGFPLVLGLVALMTGFILTGCPTPTTVYYAKYTVTFNANDGGDGTSVAGLPKAYTGVESGGRIARPSPDPTREGHTFGGWYKEKAAATAWDFDKDTVNGDITLYAKWIPTMKQAKNPYWQSAT